MPEVLLEDVHLIFFKSLRVCNIKDYYIYKNIFDKGIPRIFYYLQNSIKFAYFLFHILHKVLIIVTALRMAVVGGLER